MRSLEGTGSAEMLVDFDVASPAFIQDPFPTLDRLRNEAPAWRDPGSGAVWISTYDLIMEINQQPQVFSNDIAGPLCSGSTGDITPEEVAVMRRGVKPAVTLLMADPPAHTRFHKLAMKAFTYRRVEGMSSYIAAVTNDLIDRFIDDGACEFRAAFGAPLPMMVMADALGAPREDMDRFGVWSDALLLLTSGVADPAARLAAAGQIVEFQHYIVALANRERASPGEDVISDLVQADLAEEGDTRKLNDAELLSIIQQLLVAVNETTAHSLVGGLHYLLVEPDRLAKLIASPDLTPGFVEEVLRMTSPASAMWRRATCDTKIGGVRIAQGDLLLLRYASANRDETQFQAGEDFDIERENARSRLAFGAGIHTCLGAQLARKEMVTALPILIERLQGLRLSPSQSPPTYIPNSLFRGMAELHTVFELSTPVEKMVT